MDSGILKNDLTKFGVVTPRYVKNNPNITNALEISKIINDEPVRRPVEKILSVIAKMEKITKPPPISIPRALTSRYSESTPNLTNKSPKVNPAIMVNTIYSRANPLKEYSGKLSSLELAMVVRSDIFIILKGSKMKTSIYIAIIKVIDIIIQIFNCSGLIMLILA